MSHLTSESLARLVDESPTGREEMHLAACVRCRDTLEDLRIQTAALAALSALTPAAEAWERISARLAETPAAPLHRRPAVTRLAAAVVLFALGTVTGVAFSREAAPSPSDSSTREDPRTSATVASPPVNADAALARLRIAEMMYTSALLDYAAITSPQPPRDAVARLATLETIVLTTRTALERAPGDPLINSYHLAALAERETLLGQLRRPPETGQWY